MAKAIAIEELIHISAKAEHRARNKKRAAGLSLYPQHAIIIPSVLLPSAAARAIT